MSKPGAKKNDQIVSVTPGDVHIIMIPSPGGPIPTPIPHPCASMIKDKVAKKVKVMGQPGATKGSKSKHTPPHIPQGGPFQKPPGNKGEVMTGSSSVKYQGKDATMLGETGKMCSDPSDTPVGKVIGTAAMVLVGGGSGSGDADRAKASAKAMKAASAKCHMWINANMPPGSEREEAHRQLCTTTGHPVDVATGKMITQNIDLRLPGRIPLQFVRNYSSARREDTGPFGNGWRHGFQIELWVHADFVAHRDANGRYLAFEPIDAGERTVQEQEAIVLDRSGDEYRVVGTDGMTQVFEGTGAREGGARLFRLSAIEDRYANRLLFHHDDRGRLTRIVDAARRRVLLAWDDSDRIVALSLIADETSIEQTIRRYVYSDAGDLIEWQDELGHAYRFEYDHHLMVKETDRCGFSFYFTYDEQGWCRETWGEGGLFYRRLEYDRLRGKTRVCDSDGGLTLYEWTAGGVVELETDPHGHQWAYEYDEASYPLRIEDPNGHAWTYEYDDSGRRTAIGLPNGEGWSFEWSTAGELLKQVDPVGAEWTYEYSEDGRERRTRDPLGRETVERFDARGDAVEIESVHAGAGRIARFDERGALTEILQPNGRSIRRAHSPTGELTLEEDSLGVCKRIEYDTARRPIAVWSRGRGWTRLQRDAEGRLTRIQEPGGRVFEYEWAYLDKMRRVRTIGRDGTSSTRELEHDREGRLTEIRCSNGDVTTFEYRGRNRPMRVTFPDGRHWDYRRDGRGYVTALLENGQLVFEQECDAEGNVLRRETGDGTVYEMVYDGCGRLLEATGTGDVVPVTIERDVLGRVVAERAGDLPAVLRDIGPDGRRTSQHFGDELTVDLEWALESSGSSFRVAREGRPDFELEYDTRGRLRAQQYVGGRVDYEYGELDQPLARALSTRNGAGLREEFTYDADGLLVARTGADQREEYERDGRGRLVAWRSEEGPSVREKRWAWDSSDDRSSVVEPDGTARIDRFAAGHRPVSLGDEPLHYDERGRVTSHPGEGGSLDLEWDALGQLRKVRLADGRSVEMRYDALGRRVEKRCGDDLTEFVWLGHQLVSERHGDDGTVHYLYHPESMKPLGRYVERDGEWQAEHFVTDLVGRPERLIGADGATRWEQTGDPWGQDAAQGIALPGQFRDSETGLHYNFHRYYSPQLGSYLSPDSAGAMAGESAYGYVADPICWSDPLGLSGDDYDDGGASGGGGATSGPSSSTTVSETEVIAKKPVKPEDAVDEWDRFLGPPPHSNRHPRTGAEDPDRIVSADGTRSIRYGSHETGGKPTKHHYHEETWTYDPDKDHMHVDNTVVRVPLPKKK